MHTFSVLCLPVVTQSISCLPTVVAAMEMVATTPNGTGTVPAPFQRRDVEEWSGLNRLTGMLEHARVETDHWATKTQNSVHNYGKVIDSRNQCTPDGNNLQKARRQLEVFQSKVPGGSVQVIRTQTSSSSKWSTGTPNGAPGFQDLKLALNPLDTSSQKTKANVGRSGSIGGRRPPTRPRSSITVDDDDVTARLERVSRLCQQLHNETLINPQSDTENNSMPYDHKTSTTPLDNQKPNQTLSGTSNYNPTHTPQLIKPQSNNTTRTLESNYVRSHLPEHSTTNTTSFLSRTTLDESTDSRNYLNSDKKSNLLTRTLDINNFDSSSNSDTWRSKSYSSHRKPHLDAGGRLNSVLRNTKLDLEALDHILKSISSSSSSNSEESNEKDLTTKRQSFVTVESLKEVKGRLRRLSSPGEDLNLVDDGIAMPNPKVTKVRSYVYGMEALLHKAPLLGTGSLESRVSSKGNGSCNRSEDWFNRRKSYGFEKVNNQQINVCLRSKNKIESSTDSGICRSTEIVVPQVQKLLFVPKSTIINLSSDTKTNNNAEHELFNVWNRRAINEKVTTSTPTTPDTKRHSIAVDDSKYVQHPEVPKYRRTSLAIGDTYDLDDLSSNSERKPKRVEFCKTEVHFAAESGRVNIVETDEKPPPTQNFRRRRRTNSNVTNNHVPEVLIKTGLPLIHFGDTTYEKKLFGVVDEPVLQEAFNTDLKTSGNGHEVTVSVLKDYEIEATNTLESENPPRSILKNKISKPKPYILGDAFMGATNETDEDNIWGVRLRPVYKQEVALPRIWRSTVTVQNTAYASQEPEVDIEVAKPEFQKLLFALRPSRRSESSIPKCEVKEEVEVDLRRSSWSVADRVKQVEDVKEVKGFSTKVNFGSGEATVVENETNVATWPRSDDVSNKDQSLNMLKQGLVVRIGRENSNHTVCSKMTTNQNTTTTTTKITIDLSPPTPTNNKFPVISSIKLPRASLHTLKSTSLILNTFTKPNLANTSQNLGITQHLKALNTTTKNPSKQSKDNLNLKHMYTQFETGKEVLKVAKHIKLNTSQSIKNTSEQKTINLNLKNTSELETINLNSLNPFKTDPIIELSPVDQLAALKKLYEDAEEHSDDSEKADAEVRSLMSGFDSVVGVQRGAEEQEEVSSVVSGSWSKMKAFRNIKQHLNSGKDDPKRMIEYERFRNVINTNTYTKKGFQSSKQQPQVSKHLGGFRYENKSNAEAKVSIRTFESKPLEELPKKSFSYPRKDIETNRTQLGVSFPKRLTNEHATYKREVLIDKNKLLKNLDSSISGKNIRKTYGANQSPKPIKSTRIWNKPDLLQHYNNREYVNLSAVIQNPQKPTSNQLKTITKRPDSPTVQRSESPIYENIDEVISGLHSGLKQESEILEELTRAADQILQAVNGYTDEESLKFSSGEDEDKKHRLNLKMSNDLSTITETKSLGAVVMKQSRVSLTKTRVKTSSNSSIESLSREAKPVPPVRMNRAAKLSEDKNRKKITGSSSEVTRARRLQRASSREALLQSHGSSSEDITSSVEVRKPRLTRRLKTASEEVVEGNRRLSASQGGKKIGLDAKKSVDRASGLQEIRHKTAVSTIKSTAEKAAIRSSKTQSVEVRKRFTTCSNVSSLMSRGGVSAMTSPQGRVDANGISALRIGKGLYVMRCNSILALDTRNAECPCMCS